MECDNNGDNNDATPVANPTIRYATFIGNNSTENHRGLRLREGTYVNLSNALVCGKPDPITLDTPQTVASFDNGKSSISNTVIVGELLNEEGAGYDNAAFLADGNSSVEEMSFTGKYVGMIGESGAVSADDNWTQAVSHARPAISLRFSQHSLLQEPNGRSSHSLPPRGKKDPG